MKLAIAILSLALVTGCAGLSDREQRVGSGAIIGGVAGNVLGGGSAIGTIGGAVLGGVVGDSVDRNARDRNAQYQREREIQAQRERDAQYQREREVQLQHERRNQTWRDNDYNRRYNECLQYKPRAWCAKKTKR